jgi:glycosyltransferase involved in cell wall biosynthesis
MIDRKPLLSICIPTYNRSSFLRVMLQALLPQVAECSDQVEVWVLDNASPDETPAVIEESRVHGPFQYCRNESNIGPLRNILKGPCELARGEFVWILGDHNLVVPHGINKLLSAISSRVELDVFLGNYRVAVYPDNWPNSAIGGHDGNYHHRGGESLDDRYVEEWNELVTSQNAACTAVYAHVVRTVIWQQYWKDKTLSEPYLDGISTYPHTWMLIEQLFRSPAYYVGSDLLTIFVGAQSWGNPETQANVYLRGLPDLLKRYRKAGLKKTRLLAVTSRFCVPETRRVLVDVFKTRGIARYLPMVTRACMRYPYLVRVIFESWVESKCDLLSRGVGSIRKAFVDRHNWWIFNCRPMRWYRSQFQRPESK